jgi:hypothetical protein
MWGTLQYPLPSLLIVIQVHRGRAWPSWSNVCKIYVPVNQLPGNRFAFVFLFLHLTIQTKQCVQMLENGANSFLIACIIPITGTKTSRSRPLEATPVAVPHMSDATGLSVRLDAAGALSNLALSEQTRQMLMATGIFEVLEEVGAWDQGAGEQQAGFNGGGGSRLLREPRELIDRLATFVRTMCGEDKCRRRVRSSSKLQSLASVMPAKLSEYSKYQDNAMQHEEVFCSTSIYSTRFIAVDRKLSAEHA